MFHPLIEPLEARIAPATLSIGTPAILDEGPSGTHNLTFTVTLTGTIEADVMVHFATADGTAKVDDSDYVSKMGTLTFQPNGAMEQLIEVAINGDNKHEANETFTVTLDSPSSNDVTLDPAATSATGTIGNDDDSPTINITAATVPVVEGDNGTQNAVFNITLSNPSSDVVSVVATTAGGVAVAGSDFVFKTETITFNPGDPLTKTFTVAVNGDLLDELDENFFVNLTGPTNATPGIVQASQTIVNDDIRVRVADGSIVEGDAGDVTLDFVVKLSTASNHEVIVNYTTENLTAVSTADFDAQLTGMLRFAAGETSKVVSINVHGDLVGELDETFRLKLTSATNATLSQATATGTILNDDASLRIADFEIREGNAGTTQATFTVTLDHGPASGDVTVEVMTVDGTGTNGAVAGSDFIGLPGMPPMTLTFAPGQTTKTVTVDLIGDTSAEANETFQVMLANPSANATIVRSEATGTILNDDGNVFTIEDATVTEGDAGMLNATFILRRISGSGVAPSNITVTTIDGTAVSVIPNPDFDSKTESFNVGSTLMMREITVPIRGDLIHEATETFSLMVSSTTSGVTFLRSTAIGTILDNDLPTVSIANATLVEGESGTSYMLFEATLSQPSTELVEVSFATQNTAGAQHPATPGVDYTAITDGTITFEPGQTKTAIHIPILGDAIEEFDETFAVMLSNPMGATLGTTLATGTILSDDAIIISISDRDIVEGSSGITNAQFTLTLNRAPTMPVTVMVSTADDTATAGSDYVATSMLFTFNANETSKTFSVPIIGDTLDENDESFVVNLTDATNALLLAEQVRGNIDNDELSVRVNDVSIAEGSNGDTTLNFTVNLSTVSNHAVIVSFETQDGTAISTGADADFVAVTDGMLTFNPGVTSLPVSVTVHGDLVGEASESFLLKLTDATNALISRAIATGTILNDDASLRINDVQVLEGDANSTTQAVFTVTLENGPASGNVTVDVMTGGGDATAGDDYTALVPPVTTLTFLPGETTKTVSVPVKGDISGELNETFLVQLSNPSANATIVRDTGTGTILNDDGNVLTINDVTITEGDNGMVNAVFLVRLLKSPTAEVKVDVTTMDGSATIAGNDYAALPTPTVLTFAKNTTVLQQLVSVQIRGDLIKEATETFRVVLSNPTGGATIAKTEGIGTILDNNDPAPTISIGNATLIEGDLGTSFMTFEATLSQPSDAPVSASFSTQDGGGIQGATASNGDYTPVLDGSVNFEPGQTKATIRIPIIGDTTDEFDETFGVSIFNPVGATLGVSSAIGTIQNDEVRISISGIDVDDVSQVEGNNGGTLFTFQVKLSQAPIGHPVLVNFTTADGTTISTGANADYVSKSGTLTFPAGSNAPQTISVMVNGDTRIEGDEQFFLNLLAPQNATIADGQAIGTISNDDGMPKISILDALPITEANGGTPKTFLNFTIQLDKKSDVPVTVNVNTAPGTAPDTALADAGTDYIALANQTITFAPGETMKTVPVEIVGDLKDEPIENFTVQLSNPSNATLDRAAATGTILDNDLRTLSISAVSVAEGDSGTAKTLKFTVNLSQASEQIVMVDYATADLSAIAGVDYQALSGTLTFNPAETSKTVEIPINGDTLVEGNETFLLKLSNAHNALLGATTQERQAVGTIIDDESTVKLVAVTSTSVDEENEVSQAPVVQFRVERGGDLSKAVTVEYRTVDGTALGGGARPDFTPQTRGTIHFAAGSDTADALISIPITKDQNYEFDETFKVQLFNPVNAAVLSGGNKAEIGEEMVTIIDNDQAPAISIGNASVVEGNAGTQNLVFEVTLSAANERDDVTLKYRTQDGPDPNTRALSAVGGSLLQDYSMIGLSADPLTIPKGSVREVITVHVNGDTRDESDNEFLEVVLSNPNNAVLNTVAAIGTGTIVDDDAAPTLQLVSTDVPISEGDAGEKSATFSLRLSAISERNVSVRVTTHDQTAVSTPGHPDFVAVDKVFEFAPGNSQQISVSIPVLGDTLDEATQETFTVMLSDAEFAQIGSSTGTVTITDDDAPPAITVNDVSVQEGNDGTTDLVFTVSLSAPSEQKVTVEFGTADDTASSTGAFADYVAKSGMLEFQPGEISKEVRVKVNGDTFKESSEKFLLKLSNAANGTILTPSGAGTILSEGDTAVGIAIKNGFVAEGNFGAATLNFAVELSDKLDTATTFRVVTTNGTAVAGRDFVEFAGNVTIDAGAKSTMVGVTVIGDGAFEPTESLFASLRGVPEGITVVDEQARGTIYNDDGRRVNSHTLQYIDVDGDLATVHVSEGRLSFRNLGFGAANSIGGHQLQLINLTNRLFQNSDVSVNAGKQRGFTGDPQGKMGDGHVNVGLLLAAIPHPDILQVTDGIDLGTVQIDGDLGRIFAGDVLTTPAIESLQVRSFGRFGTDTQSPDSAGTLSLILGPVNNLSVAGTMTASLEVLGGIFGSIRNLNIGGALLGGTEAESGEIHFTGKLRQGYIGSVTGGAGANSGRILGSFASDASIGNLHIGGLVTGGAGQGSGSIQASTIESLKINGLIGGSKAQSGWIDALNIENLVVTGNVRGGVGEDSGQILGESFIKNVKIRGRLQGNDGARSGTVISNHGIDRISIFGGIFGGSGATLGSVVATTAIDVAEIGGIFGAGGDRSGAIKTGGGILSLNVFGNIEGGTGANSGGIEVGKLLRHGVIDGSIIGGNAKADTSLVKSGYIIADRIESLYVGGDLKAGQNGGTGLALSGTIRAEKTIGFVRIHGDLLGNEGTAAIIAAAGKGNDRAAIANLKIDGLARFAEVLAGYGVNATTSNVRGQAVNADARIGSVTFGDDVESISVIAGAAAGTDGLFGTADDTVLAGTDAAKAKSKIAKIIVEGTASAGTTSAGIVAQYVKSVRVATSNVALDSGAGNDTDRDKEELPGGSKIHVFELPLPI